MYFKKYYYTLRSMHTKEMVQCVRLCKHEDWSLNPQHPHKKSGMDTCIYSPQSSLASQINWNNSFLFFRDPISRQHGSDRGSHPLLAPQVPTQVDTLTQSKVTTTYTQSRARPGGGTLHFQLSTGWRKKITSSKNVVVTTWIQGQFGYLWVCFKVKHKKRAKDTAQW